MEIANVLGREFDIFPGVLSPGSSSATSFTSRLIYQHVRENKVTHALEVGTGCGAIAVFAALAGAQHVVATDINPHAVRCAAHNFLKHNLSHVIDVRESDLFANIKPNEKFGLIIFNLPYILKPDGAKMADYLDHAFFDPGYATQRRFLEEAKNYLTRDGVIAVSFSSAGSMVDFITSAFGNGYDLFMKFCEDKPSATNPNIIWDRRFYLLRPHDLKETAPNLTATREPVTTPLLLKSPEP